MGRSPVEVASSPRWNATEPLQRLAPLWTTRRPSNGNIAWYSLAPAAVSDSRTTATARSAAADSHRDPEPISTGSRIRSISARARACSPRSAKTRAALASRKWPGVDRMATARASESDSPGISPRTIASPTCSDPIKASASGMVQRCAAAATSRASRVASSNRPRRVASITCRAVTITAAAASPAASAARANAASVDSASSIRPSSTRPMNRQNRPVRRNGPSCAARRGRRSPSPRPVGPPVPSGPTTRRPEPQGPPPTPVGHRCGGPAAPHRRSVPGAWTGKADHPTTPERAWPEVVLAGRHRSPVATRPPASRQDPNRPPGTMSPRSPA